MISIEVNKLLPIIIENKQKHNNIYNLAVSGYWNKAEEVLNKKLIQIKNHEKIDAYLGFNYPVSYENEYDKVIRMLQLTSDKEISLDFNQFDAFVRNEWNWKNTFLSSNTSYITGCMVQGGEYVIGKNKLDF